MLHALGKLDGELLPRRSALIRIVGVDVARRIVANGRNEVPALCPETVVAIVHGAYGQRTLSQCSLERLHAGCGNVLRKARVLLEYEWVESPCRSAVLGAIAIFHSQSAHFYGRNCRVNERGHDLRHGGRSTAAIANGLAGGMGAVFLILPATVPLKVVDTPVDGGAIVAGGGFRSGVGRLVNYRRTDDQRRPGIGSDDAIHRKRLGALIGGDGLLGQIAEDTIRRQLSNQELYGTGCRALAISACGAGRRFLCDLCPCLRPDDAICGQAMLALPCADVRDEVGVEVAQGFLSGGKTCEVLSDLDHVAVASLLNCRQHRRLPPRHRYHRPVLPPRTLLR